MKTYAVYYNTMADKEEFCGMNKWLIGSMSINIIWLRDTSINGTRVELVEN